MPKRLYSRQGCLRCRLRRKKCDEQRPTCKRCQTSHSACIWRGSDNTAIHVLPSSKTLSRVHETLHSQDAKCTFDISDVVRANQVCPRFAISPGYTPLRNSTEHRLLINLSSFLNMLILNEKDQDHTHILRMSMQSLWVRDALLAFAAYVSSARTKPLRTIAYQYYSASVISVQKEVLSTHLPRERENLLIATLFLGLMELTNQMCQVNNPENSIFPLLHFEAVGHLLQMVAEGLDTHTDMSQSLFHRTALESYLYHVSILSLFYPQTNRYSQLSPEIEKQLSSTLYTSVQNVIISLDINIYRILLGLTILGRTKPSDPTYNTRLGDLQSLIDALSETNTYTPSPPTSPQANDSKDLQHRRMTRVATRAVRIFIMKVRDRTILPSNTSIIHEVTSATQDLQLSLTQRAWTGNLVWIFTILLCAAHTTNDFEALCSKLDEVRSGMWGSDLARIQHIVHIVQRKRQDSCELAASSDGIVRQTDHDTLMILLNPEGVLAE